MNPNDKTDRHSDEAECVADRNVERLLQEAYRPEVPDPQFIEQATAAMHDAAQQCQRPMPIRPSAVTSVRVAIWTAVAVLLIATGMIFGGMWNSEATRPSDGGEIAEVQPPVTLDNGALVRRGIQQLTEVASVRPPMLKLLAVQESNSGMVPLPVVEQSPLDALAVGDSLETGKTERRRATLPDGSILFLNENTSVTLSGHRRVTLHGGEVYVEVSPRHPAASQEVTDKDRFAVITPQRTVTALGTKFNVRHGDTGTAVTVTQGKVRISGLKLPLSAGQQLAASSGETTDAIQEISTAPRTTHVIGWTRDLIAAARSPLVPASDHAGGSLIAIDPNGQEMKLSLRKYHVDVHIEDGFARTTIDLTYFNHLSSRLEGTFYFPLPPDASLSRLAMYVGEKLMEGGMAERQHARETFENIVRKMQDPALLEWVDGSTFKMRVFPLEGRQEKRIVLSYTQRLPSLYRQTSYRFPSGHNLPIVGKWSAAIRVKDGAKLRYKSDSHDFRAKKGDADLLLTASAENVEPNRDVVLMLTERKKDAQAREDVRFGLAKHEQSQYLMLRWRPELSTAQERQRRDWVVLFEAAADRDPVLARAQIDIIKTLLQNAEHDDTFAILTAGTRIHKFAKKPQAATPENVERAIEFLEQTHLVGALDLGQAFDAAGSFAEDCENPYLVHVGSGVPILGELDTTALLGRIPEGTRYVGVGVGKRWGRAMMKRAAAQTGGHFTQINPDEEITWRTMELAATLNTTRLLNIAVVDQTEKHTFLCHTDSLADGEELCAIARLDKDAKLPKVVEVTGMLDGKLHTEQFKVDGVTEGAGYLPRIWAKLQIDRLLAEGAEQNKSEIIRLSKAMYVMSPFTSLLVLENEAMYKQYNIDRGRKDHWALYPCPKTIKVVHEPLGRRFVTNDPTEPTSKKPSPMQVMRTIITPGWRPMYRWPGTQSQWGEQDGVQIYSHVRSIPLLGATAVVSADRRYVRITPSPMFPGIGEVNTFNTAGGNNQGGGGGGGGGIGGGMGGGGFGGGQMGGGNWNFVDGRLGTASGLTPLGLGRRGENYSRYGFHNYGDFNGPINLTGGSLSMGDFDREGLFGTTGSGTVSWNDGLGMQQGLGPIPGWNNGYIIARLSSSLDGRLLAAGSSDSMIQLWDVNGNPFMHGVDWSRRGDNDGDGVSVIWDPPLIDTGENGASTTGRNGPYGVLASFDSMWHGSGQFGWRQPRVSPSDYELFFQGHLEVPSHYDGFYLRGTEPGRNTLDVDFDRSVIIGMQQPGVFSADLDIPFTQESLRDMLQWKTFYQLQSQRLRVKRQRGIVDALHQTELSHVPFPDEPPIVYPDVEIWSRLTQEGPSYIQLPSVMSLAGNQRPQGTAAGFYPMAYPIVNLDAESYGKPLKYELPEFDNNWNVYSDLLRYAPGMHTNRDDVAAVIEAEAELGEGPKTGKIDEKAQRLIEQARGRGWQNATISDPDNAGKVLLSIRFDGTGRYSYSRATGRGLRERVVCDGANLWHVYPELGLASQRTLSRFHRRYLGRIVPWVLLPAEEMARGADLKMIDRRTIVIVPHSIEKLKELIAKDKKLQEKLKEPLKYALVHLIFDAKDGRLAERRLVEMPSGKTLLRQTYAADGTIRWLDAKNKELAKRKISLEPCGAPNLTPDEKQLVIVPMPLRVANLDFPFKGNGVPGQSPANDAQALASVLAMLRVEPEAARQFLAQRFLNHENNRLGLYTLLLATGHTGNPEHEHDIGGVQLRLNPLVDHPDSLLAKYMTAYLKLRGDEGDNKGSGRFGPIDDPGLLGQLAEFHDLYAAYDSGDARQDGQATLQPYQDQTIDFLGRCKSPELGWALLKAAQNERSVDVFYRKLGELFEQFNDVPRLAYAARYESAKALHTSGRNDDARDAFTKLHADAIKAGMLPPIEMTFRLAFNQGNHHEQWRKLMRDAAKELIERKCRPVVVRLAWQARQVGDPQLGDELFRLANSDVDELEQLPVTLAAVEYLFNSDQHAKADNRLQTILDDPKYVDWAWLWQLAYRLADKRGHTARALGHLERSIVLKHESQRKVIRLDIVRADYSGLLDRYRQLADSVSAPDMAPPRDLVGRIVRVADRWRAADSETRDACHTAAKILSDLGAAELAWDYLTTPLAAKPNEAVSWKELAEELRNQAQPELAARAYASAFTAEPSDPQLLWDRAQVLSEAGQADEAQAVYETIATGAWQPRFDSLQSKAKQLVSGGAGAGRE